MLFQIISSSSSSIDSLLLAFCVSFLLRACFIPTLRHLFAFSSHYSPSNTLHTAHALSHFRFWFGYLLHFFPYGRKRGSRYHEEKKESALDPGCTEFDGPSQVFPHHPTFCFLLFFVQLIFLFGKGSFYLPLSLASSISIRTVYTMHVMHCVTSKHFTLFGICF